MSINFNSHKPLELPGIRRVSFKSNFLKDFVFFLFVVALPSSFFNFVDRSFFGDLKVVFLIVGVSYLLIYFKYLPKIMHIAGGKLLIGVVLFLLFKLFHSALVQGINIVEVATIFRANFFYPIATLGFLLYAAKMDNHRIHRFMSWLFTATFILCVVYIISNLTGVDFYAQAPKDYQTFSGIVIVQNLFAIPQYTEILYAFAIYAALTMPKFKRHWLWIVPLAVTVLSIVRSQMIVFVLIMFFMYVFGLRSSLRLRTTRLVKLSVILCFFAVFILSMFPGHIGRVIEKFGLDQTNMKMNSYVEQGTLKVRLELIKSAYERTKDKNNIMLGNGYIRESTKGEYDFVVGGDTLIAPVLWTEGFSGLIVRLLPVLYCLYFALNNLRNKNTLIASVSLIMASLIVPQIINGIQTIIFVHYHYYLFIFYLLMMLIYNDKKEKLRENSLWNIKNIRNFQ